jgi:hypothetical protein
MTAHTLLRSTPPPTTGGPATIWCEAEERRGELIADLYTADLPELRSHILLQLSDQALLQATVHDAAFGALAGDRGQALLREAALLDLLSDAESARAYGRERVRRTGDEIGDLIESAGGYLLNALSTEDDDQRRRALMDDLQAALTPRLGFQATQILTLIALLNDTEAHGPDDEGDDDGAGGDLAAEATTGPVTYWPTEACADLVPVSELTHYAADATTYWSVPLDIVAEPAEPADTGANWTPPTTSTGSLPYWPLLDPARGWLNSQRLRRRRHAAIGASIVGALTASMAAVSPQTFHPLLRQLHPHITAAGAVQAVLAGVVLMVLSGLATAAGSRLTFQAPTWNPLTWVVGRRWYRPGQLVTYKGELAVTSDWMRQTEYGERAWVLVLFFADPVPYEPLVPDGWWLPLDDLIPVDY